LLARSSGRFGNTAGEAVLVVGPRDSEIGRALLLSTPEDVISQLVSKTRPIAAGKVAAGPAATPGATLEAAGGEAFVRAVLGFLAVRDAAVDVTGTHAAVPGLDSYLANTLLAAEGRLNELNPLARLALGWLEENGFAARAPAGKEGDGSGGSCGGQGGQDTKSIDGRDEDIQNKAASDAGGGIDAGTFHNDMSGAFVSTALGRAAHFAAMGLEAALLTYADLSHAREQASADPRLSAGH